MYLLLPLPLEDDPAPKLAVQVRDSLGFLLDRLRPLTTDQGPTATRHFVAPHDLPLRWQHQRHSQ